MEGVFKKGGTTLEEVVEYINNMCRANYFWRNEYDEKTDRKIWDKTISDFDKKGIVYAVNFQSYNLIPSRSEL